MSRQHTGGPAPFSFSLSREGGMPLGWKFLVLLGCQALLVAQHTGGEHTENRCSKGSGRQQLRLHGVCTRLAGKGMEGCL